MKWSQQSCTWWRVWVVVVCVWGVGVELESSVAHANGFEFPDNGAKSIGRGGAYMLGATGPEVVYYNPALLTRLKGFQVTVGSNLLDLNLRFERASEPAAREGEPDTTFDPVENEAGMFPVPMLFVSHDFGLDSFGFGLGVYGPHAYGSRTFPQGGAQRYMGEDVSILEIYPSAAAAFQYEGFRIGATFQLSMLYLDYTLATSASPSPDAEDPEFDARTTLRDIEDIQPTGILGVAYDVSESLSFGLTYQLPVDFDAKGKLDIEFPDILNDPEGINARAEGDDLTFKTSQADKIRASARWAYIEDGKEFFDLELVGTYERWSRVDRYLITPDVTVRTYLGDIEFQENVLEPIEQNKKWEDTWSIRLGSDWATTDWLTMRSGGYYSSAAVPNAYTNVDFAGWERAGFGLGATFHVWDFDIDAGYMYTHQFDREVTQGEVRLEAPLAEGETSVVNNGRWTSNLHAFSLGLTYRFGGQRTSTTPAIQDLSTSQHAKGASE